MFRFDILVILVVVLLPDSLETMIYCQVDCVVLVTCAFLYHISTIVAYYVDALIVPHKHNRHGPYCPRPDRDRAG